MDMLSENPSSLRFRMDKNSATASELKESITDKLNQFLVNYTDDVLAEYIVVLVCNGKDQNQARDHLEAFLGDRSAEFVSWLWDLLLRSVDDSHMLGVVKNNHKNRTQRGLHNRVRGDANTLLNDEHEDIPSTFVPQPVFLDNNEVSEGSQHCSQGSDTSLNEIEIKQRKRTFRLPKISRPTDENSSEVLQYATSEAKVYSRVSDNSEQSMIPVHENKINSIYENHLPRQPIPLAKYERPSCNLRSITKENPKYGLPAETDVTEKRFSSRPIGSMSNRSDDTRRGSVWDRLGKAGDVSRTTSGKNNDVVVDVVKRRIVEPRGEAHDRNMLMQFLPGARFNGSLKRGISASDIFSDTVIPNTSNDDDYKKLEYDPRPAHKTNRKRQFSEIGSVEEGKYKQLHHTKPLKQFERLSPAKYNSTESLNNISSGTRQTELPYTCPDVSTKELNGEALDPTKTNVKPVQSQLLEMKLRLHQIEMQMSKLKTKQLESNEGKLELLPNFGALNHSDEDVESRTVFVTNVHFAATKEALSLHFSKCGVIVNITILKEPKGAAYITFIQKEAAEKAVTLSGTSFWSRTLKIVRKRELPVVAPLLLAGNPSLPRLLQPNRKIVFPRPYSGSLQWRRDQVVSTGCSGYAPRYGLEGSETVQQKSNDSEGQLCDLSVTNTNTAKEEEEPTVTLDKEQSKETQDKEKRDESTGENQVSMKICAAS